MSNSDYAKRIISTFTIKELMDEIELKTKCKCTDNFLCTPHLKERVQQKIAEEMIAQQIQREVDSFFEREDFIKELKETRFQEKEHEPIEEVEEVGRPVMNKCIRLERLQKEKLNGEAK